MFCLTTVGPDNATRAVLPFVAAKGAAANGDKVAMFAMQEATYLGSTRHADLAEIKAPGLDPVQDVLDHLVEQDALDAFIVCKPCADARGIEESDLQEWAKFGGAPDLHRLATDYAPTVTF